MMVLCRCGGWVMVAATDHATAGASRREAAVLVRRGFDFRALVPFAEYLRTPHCEHGGRCTDDPGSLTDPRPLPDPNQTALGLEEVAR